MDWALTLHCCSTGQPSNNFAHCCPGKQHGAFSDAPLGSRPHAAAPTFAANAGESAFATSVWPLTRDRFIATVSPKALFSSRVSARQSTFAHPGREDIPFNPRQSPKSHVNCVTAHDRIGVSTYQQWALCHGGMRGVPSFRGQVRPEFLNQPTSGAEARLWRGRTGSVKSSNPCKIWNHDDSEGAGGDGKGSRQPRHSRHAPES